MRRKAVVAALFLIASASFTAADAQGKSKGGGGAASRVPPGQAKKVTPDAAIATTREMLSKHGFTFVRVEIVDGARVVYYRRGNNGRGRGLGPMEKMIIRPSRDIVVFEGGPSVVLVDVRLKLGL